ncbi:MAG TPA: ABC transporter permease subunit [Clostridium sp.]
MLSYIIKRTLAVIPTILLVSIFVFMFVRVIPGDPAALAAGPDATLEARELIREELGLNKPILEQYRNYIIEIFKGDLGTSLKTKRPVNYEIGLRYMNTVKLAGVSLAWSVIVGILIGVFSGKNRSKWQDYLGMTTAASGISIPSFWIGLMLISIFSVKLKILPTVGAGTWKHLVLPAFTLGIGIAAIIARFTRSSIIEILKEDYIRTARAKGLKERWVIWKHVFRNSMISVVTVIGLQCGFLLGGSVITESVFAYPGLGTLLIDSVNFRDYPTIQALILIFALHFIVINLIVDVLYAVLNPEIQLG